MRTLEKALRNARLRRPFSTAVMAFWTNTIQHGFKEANCGLAGLRSEDRKMAATASVVPAAGPGVQVLLWKLRSRSYWIYQTRLIGRDSGCHTVSTQDRSLMVQGCPRKICYLENRAIKM